MQPGDSGSSFAEDVAGVVTAVQALERELAGLPAEASESVLAASAFAMARMLDDPETLGTARTGAARELRETVAALRAMAPARVGDRFDELERRRGQRLAGAG